jgi:predicted metal-dependent peptidase
LYVEELVGDNVNIAICIDTSGSVGTDDLKRFMGEVRGIFDAYPQLRGQLFFGDTKLYGPHAVGADVALPTARGGGGTSFIPFFEWIDVHQAAQLAIYFTDGMGTFPAGPPNLPTLWVVSPGGLETGRFPFGDVARMGLV